MWDKRPSLLFKSLFAHCNHSVFPQPAYLLILRRIVQHGSPEHVVIQDSQRSDGERNTERAFADLDERTIMPAVDFPAERTLHFVRRERQMALNRCQMSWRRW